MEALITKLGEALLSQFGLLGIVTSILCLIVWLQYRQNQELHEKRFDDQRELIELAQSVKSAIELLTSLIKDRRRV